MVSNRRFRRITIAAGVLLVAGLLIAGLLLAAHTISASAPNDIGKSFISGAVISAAFFTVGWLVDRSGTRRQYAGEIVAAVSADLREVRRVAETARFYIALNHSAPTYRDQVSQLNALLATVRDDDELVSNSDPKLDNYDAVCVDLREVASQLDEIRQECRRRYPKLSQIAADHPKDTSKHQEQLETFTSITKILKLEWHTTANEQWSESPLTESVNRAIAALHGRPTHTSEGRTAT
jgi:hypothetical protein